MWCELAARPSSRSSANGGGGPSKMLTPPMCIGVTSFSTCRNIASCALMGSIAGHARPRRSAARRSASTSLPVFSPRKSRSSASGNSSTSPSTTSSRERSSPLRSHCRELGDALAVAVRVVEDHEARSSTRARPAAACSWPGRAAPRWRCTARSAPQMTTRAPRARRGEHGVEDLAADVVEEDVDAVGRVLAQLRAQTSSAL